MQNGKTKFTIENATRTRIVLADTRIHILGSYQNIRIARDAICALIMGSPPVCIAVLPTRGCKSGCLFGELPCPSFQQHLRSILCMSQGKVYSKLRSVCARLREV